MATAKPRRKSTAAAIPMMYFKLLFSSVFTGSSELPPFVGTEAVRGTAKDELKFLFTFLVS